MKYQGWIKVYRQILDNPISKRPDYCHVWLILMLLAQHEPSEYIWNGEKKRLRPGQLMTGRKSLSELCGLHESKIQRILKFLETEQQIEQQKTNRFRIITIKNWGKYQGNEKGEQQIEQPVNNQRTTSEQPVNTYKNDNNDNNGNNDIAYTLQQVSDTGFLIGFSDEQCKIYFDHYNAQGWLLGGGLPITDLSSAMTRWRNNSYKFEAKKKKEGDKQKSTAELTAPLEKYFK